MLKSIVFGIACAAVVLAEWSVDCGKSPGTWTKTGISGTNDATTTGVAPNPQYFCWDPQFSASDPLHTGIVNQTIRVKLADSQNIKTFRVQITVEELRDKIPTSIDSNYISCLDSVLRAEVQLALHRATNYTAVAVTRSLQYTIARPNWVYNAVGLHLDETPGAVSLDGFTDMNYCLYFARYTPTINDVFVIIVSAVDMS